jgi:hypothetical protein
MRIACAALNVLLLLLAACQGQENRRTETAPVDTSPISATSATSPPSAPAAVDTAAPLVGREYTADLPQFDIDALVHQGRAFVIPNGKLDPVGVLIRSYEDPRRTGYYLKREKDYQRIGYIQRPLEDLAQNRLFLDQVNIMLAVAAGRSANELLSVMSPELPEYAALLVSRDQAAFLNANDGTRIGLAEQVIGHDRWGNNVAMSVFAGDEYRHVGNVMLTWNPETLRARHDELVRYIRERAEGTTASPAAPDAPDLTADPALLVVSPPTDTRTGSAPTGDDPILPAPGVIDLWRTGWASYLREPADGGGYTPRGLIVCSAKGAVLYKFSGDGYTRVALYPDHSCTREAIKARVHEYLTAIRTAH